MTSECFVLLTQDFGGNSVMNPHYEVPLRGLKAVGPVGCLEAVKHTHDFLAVTYK